MAYLDAEKTALIQNLARTGQDKLACAVVLEVNWSSAVTRFYAETNWGELSPFQGIPFGPIEARVLNDAFDDFEFQPNLSADPIQIVFSDTDKAITGLFQRYGTVQCKIHFYWPQANYAVEVWKGQLHKPASFGHFTVSTQMTNGYWTREKLIPHSMRPPDHCRFNHFGGELPTEDMVKTNGCPYDRHLGGTEGLLNGSVPFVSCPKDEEACQARFGHLRYFGGYSTDASATVSDGNTGYMAISKGNTSSNTRPIPVLAGTKHIRGLNLLLYRREPNQNDPERGWFAGVAEVSDGRVKNIRNIKVNDKLIEQIHLSVVRGERGQGPVANYNQGGAISNFSGVAHFAFRYGWTNPLNLTPSQISIECDADGYDKVAVWNPTAPGAGLLGVYYENTNFTSEVGRRIDHNVNLPLNSNIPMDGMYTHGFSIRWTGWITFPRTEDYTFTADHDDTALLKIDGTTIINGTSYGTSTGTFSAEAGVAYPFQLDFVQQEATGYNPWQMVLKWSSPSTLLEVVPNSAFNHDGSTGFARQFSNDRVWWVLEMYTNQLFGLGYSNTEFDTEAFRYASTWGLRNVVFSFTSPDGETRSFSHRRTTFDAYLEGRDALSQIVDTCRSGALSVPFQYEGKHTIEPFRAFTAEDLAAAPVFTDRITNQASTKRRIVHDGGPAIRIHQTPDEELPNEITLQFEAADNFDAARPITVDDPNQKRKAGQALGMGTLQTIPKRFTAFGVRHLSEAVKLAYRLLWFGEFDEGGTKNNCRVTFLTPFEFAVDLRRYRLIKIDSALLAGHGYADPFGADETPPSTPEGFGAEFETGTSITLTLGESDDVDAAAIVPFEWFRILRMRRAPGGRMEITAQAYNVEAYENFEVDANPTGTTTPADPGGSGGDGGGGDHEGEPCILQFGSPYYDKTNQAFVVPIAPC